MEIDKKIIEESFKKLFSRGDQFIDSFYAHLFGRYPETRLVFLTTNKSVFKDKLLASLMVIIKNLKTPEVLAPYLKELGRHHFEYNITPDHFPKGKEALLAAFEEVLGSEWSREHEKAWGDAYDLTVKKMLEGYK